MDKKKQSAMSRLPRKALGPATHQHRDYPFNLWKLKLSWLPNIYLLVPAAHWWLSGNVKLGLSWGSIVHCDVFVLLCCAFCMLGNVHLLFLEISDTHLVKVQGGG